MSMKPASHRKTFAKKSLGQNFLHDARFIYKIIDALGSSPMDTIVEVGPGRGALTERIVDSGATVVAIELDSQLASELSERFKGNPRVCVIERDILDIDFRSLTNRPLACASGSDRPFPPGIRGANFKLVANLPYYISTAILQRLAEQRQCFSELVLMFQKEVVERITGQPGNSERGFLTVIAEACFETEKLFDVPPEAFHPVPKVWSSVVRLKPKPPLLTDFEFFRNLVSQGFGQKRKTIHNNLKLHFENAGDALNKAEIDPSRRAESLTLAEWLSLAARLN
jgi:16S rRNA (adenine1518-N6/adenine1519-N6)-dimethyltransferase